MISQPFPNFKTQFSQKEEAGGLDHIALTQENGNNICQTEL